MSETTEKTLIGVLASHDSFEQHQSLKDIFENGQKKFGDNYHFLITGGTYDRLLNGSIFEKSEDICMKSILQHAKEFEKGSQNDFNKFLEYFYDEKNIKELEKFKGVNKSWFIKHSTRLPSAVEGGIIILSYLITQRKCSIVWPFFSHDSQHWQRLENLAFMRLCDQCHVKRLLNKSSVNAWLNDEEDYDSKLKLKADQNEIYFPHLKRRDCKDILNDKADNFNSKSQIEKTFINEINGLNCPPKGFLNNEDNDKFQDRPINLPLKGYVPNDFRKLFQTCNNENKNFADMTIALIAHDDMKPRMLDFAFDYEMELATFKKILTTGTTGKEVASASKELETKIFKCHSGPKGGDIEIATAILYGLCDVVIFFIDPLGAHPHIDDVRVVFQACMMNQNVIIITNEMHAREFMARVVRNHEKIDKLKSKSEG